MRRPTVGMFVKQGVMFEEDWARAMSSYVDLVVIKSVRRGEDASPVEGAVDTYALHVPRLRPKRFAARPNAALWTARVATFLDRIQERHGSLDLLHGHFYPMGGLLNRLRKVGYRYVLTEHSTRLTGQSAKHKKLSAAGLRTAALAYPNAEVVFLPSNYLQTCVERLGLVGRYLVVGNPIDTQGICLRHTRPKGNHVMWVGRLESDKDPIKALQGFEIARRTVPDLRLDMVGSGPERPFVERWIRDNQAGDVITLWDRQPRDVIARLLARAAVFVCSSTVETFGVAVAEALASGVPVAAPDIPPMRELVGTPSGWLYPACDVSAMADAVIELIRNRERFAPATVAGDVRTHFSFEAVGAKVAAAYQSALQSSESVG